MTAWAQVPAAQFEIVAGEAKAVQSSAHFQRHFCGACGSPTYMSGGETIGIMLGTVDDPSSLVPKGHGWTNDRISWLKITDDLPCWPEDPPYDRGV